MGGRITFIEFERLFEMSLRITHLAEAEENCAEAAVRAGKGRIDFDGLAVACHRQTMAAGGKVKICERLVDRGAGGRDPHGALKKTSRTGAIALCGHQIANGAQNLGIAWINFEMAAKQSDRGVKLAGLCSQDGPLLRSLSGFKIVQCRLVIMTGHGGTPGASMAAPVHCLVRSPFAAKPLKTLEHRT